MLLPPTTASRPIGPILCFEQAPEPPHRHDLRAVLANALGEPLVRGDDAERGGVPRPRHAFGDLVVGGVAPARRERHPEAAGGGGARRRALVGAAPVEHHRYLLAA